MKSANKLKIGRKESYLFFRMNCLPVHPKVIKELKEKGSLDYELMSQSLDEALDWTYRDLQEHPELIPEKEFLSPLQTPEGNWTRNIEVLKNWLKKGKHFYYKKEKGEIYTGKDTKSFPFSSLTLVDSGIYFGANPIIITYDPAFFPNTDLRHYGKRELLTPEVLKEFEITEKRGYYRIPATWYTKTAEPLIRLFGKNFSINYNNKKVKEK